jgi:DNA helicase HerA-like ATPase
MGTMLIHRLINDQDRSVVERACGEMDSTSLQAIPSLTPGEAVLLGVEFSTPLIVKVERPQCEPSSHGPNYQKHWRI